MNITELPSEYNHLEQMSVGEIVTAINALDIQVSLAVEKALPVIEKVILQVLTRMQQGGRLFYIGSGTSGRLGILDASECPPTYGVPDDLVVGLIAGGDGAIRKAVEFAEDDTRQAWHDLQTHEIHSSDAIIGLSASGSTPYVIGGIKSARQKGIFTAGITCNTETELSRTAEITIEAVVGPEFVTGSTRMKAGTAQKMILNMISTALMIKLGHVKGNQMIDMQLKNKKLLARGEKMVAHALNIDYEMAHELLKKYGSVRKAIENYK